MQGMNHASNMTLSVIVVTEYTSPKYRGAFLAFKSATLFWGIWVANAMGTFFYWKYIPLLGIFLSIFCFTVLFWPESPQWLASKGRFEECVSAHRWLRGTDSKAEKELKQLIQSQTDSIKSCKEIPKDNIVKLFSRKEFYKPMLLSVLMMMQHHLSGKVVCMVYSIDIIRKITDSESAAYTGMLILDGVTVTGMYFGCYLSKILKRRQLLFSTCAVAILCLFILSLYLYLVDLKVITENRVLTISLFTIFSLSISCGPMILSTSIYGELTPLRYKSSCTMISALVFVILTSTLLKLFPLIVRTINMSGVFLIYAISSLIVSSILFKYLPETKDRTLQEIEDIFSNKKMTEEEKGNTHVNTTQILISVIMQGMNQASIMTLSIIIVSEYTSPKYRGSFLAFKSATLFWGIWVANAMGTFLHWKYIPLLGILMSIFSFTVLFWPESPQWLASKGRFEECVSAHRWLRGTDSKAEKELKQLIQSQTDSIKSCSEIPNLDNIVNLFSRKAFYKPMLLSVLMMMQYHFSGKVVCMAYSIDIIRKITDSESAGYTGMLILDGVTVTGMYFGCYLSKILKRRQLLFSSCTVATLFLFIMSLYLHLVDIKVIAENRIIAISLLTIFSVSISCGPMILSTSIYGELTPLRYKSSCTIISALVFVILTAIFLKLFPLIVRTINMSGVFLMYAISSLIVTLILYKYLPETKDITLQEIEDIFRIKRKLKKRIQN
ncbi:Sugar transporter [Operophtera brumata]|uniref:Sugar transporter n=1 Tax=Operophtera brumata TaxID=104452 RepID=A0A0L7LBU2_OPEBR|nr:Sugar transporter [Operophtera brumata]